LVLSLQNTELQYFKIQINIYKRFTCNIQTLQKILQQFWIKQNDKIKYYEIAITYSNGKKDMKMAIPYDN
jgi:hypothetical protein